MIHDGYTFSCVVPLSTQAQRDMNSFVKNPCRKGDITNPLVFLFSCLCIANVATFLPLEKIPGGEHLIKSSNLQVQNRWNSILGDQKTNEAIETRNWLPPGRRRTAPQNFCGDINQKKWLLRGHGLK